MEAIFVTDVDQCWFPNALRKISEVKDLNNRTLHCQAAIYRNLSHKSSLRITDFKFRILILWSLLFLTQRIPTIYQCLT